MQKNRRLQAGVLPTVLFISFVFAVLSATLILYVYSQRLLFVKQKLTNELNLNARSGLNFALANPQLGYEQAYNFDLFGKGLDSIQVRKKYWGIFDLYFAAAHRGKNKYEEIALIGSKLDSITAAALYLMDESRPLSLVGNTVVQGNAFLPEAGVKAAFIQPDFYKGKELIYGEVLESTSQLPEIDKLFYDRLDYYYQSKWDKLPSGFNTINSFPTEPIVHSFSQPVLILKKQGPLILKNTSIKGNIIVHSDKAVVVERTASLENIIIVAPKVTIEPDFKGQVQIFASDSLVIGERSQLLYPSAISVKSISGAYIDLKESSQVNGIITIVNALDKPEGDMSKINRLNLEAGATVNGSIYNEGFIQLKGSVLGNVICRRFYLQTPITLYENYLHNTTIDVKQRSKYFLTSALLSSSKQHDIVQWLR